MCRFEPLGFLILSCQHVHGLIAARLSRDKSVPLCLSSSTML